MKLSLHSLLEKSIINLMFEEDNVQIGLSDAQANGLATVLTNLGIDPEAVIGEVGDGVIPEATKPVKTLETAQPVQPKVKKPKWYMKVSRKAIAAAKKYFEVGERFQEWYHDAHAALNIGFESESDRILFALLLAATSVQNEVYGNFLEASALFKAIKHDVEHNPELLKQFALDPNLELRPNKEKGTEGILSHPVYKDLSVLSTTKAMKIMNVGSKFGNIIQVLKRYLTGTFNKEDVVGAIVNSVRFDGNTSFDSRSPYISRLKIANYALTILDPSIADSDLNPFNVVVDTWMFRAFYPEKLKPTMSGEQEAPILSQLFGSDRAYETIATTVSNLAKQAGISPHEMQAAIWTGIKFEREGESAGTANYVQAINRMIDEYGEFVKQLETEAGQIAGIQSQLTSDPETEAVQLQHNMPISQAIAAIPTQHFGGLLQRARAERLRGIVQDTKKRRASGELPPRGATKPQKRK